MVLPVADGFLQTGSKWQKLQKGFDPYLDAPSDSEQDLSNEEMGRSLQLGGAPLGPAPPGRSVPYQAPPPRPLPKNQGKGQNPNPPVPPELTHPGLTSSESESDDFYVPKTPSPRSPSRDLDSSHGFFNPNPGPRDKLYDEKLVTYGNPDGSPSNI